MQPFSGKDPLHLKILTSQFNYHNDIHKIYGISCLSVLEVEESVSLHQAILLVAFSHCYSSSVFLFTLTKFIIRLGDILRMCKLDIIETVMKISQLQNIVHIEYC